MSKFRRRGLAVLTIAAACKFPASLSNSHAQGAAGLGPEFRGGTAWTPADGVVR